MSVILTDLGDEDHGLKIGNVGWRNTVDVLGPFGLLAPERLDRLRDTWLGEQVTEEEARAIGQCLVADVLSGINWSGAVYPPFDYWRTRRVDEVGQQRERDGPWNYDPDTQWASWLRSFAGFCLTCKGFDLC